LTAKERTLELRRASTSSLFHDQKVESHDLQEEQKTSNFGIGPFLFSKVDLNILTVDMQVQQL
jgi:hypothetical protein